MHPDPIYYSVSEVATRLTVSRAVVLSHIHHGDLPASDISAGTRRKPRWRISADDLTEFLKSRKAIVAMRPVKRRARRDPHVIQFF